MKEGRKLRVFENRVLRGIFGPKRDEVTGEWRKLHNEPNDLYCSHNIVRVIKSRRKWEGHVWVRGEVYTGVCWENLWDRDFLEGPGVVGRVI